MNQIDLMKTNEHVTARLGDGPVFFSQVYVHLYNHFQLANTLAINPGVCFFPEPESCFEHELVVDSINLYVPMSKVGESPVASKPS